MREFADDDRAGGVRQLGELAQMVVDNTTRAGPLEGRSNEERPLCGRCDDDRLAAYSRTLITRALVGAASCRESPRRRIGNGDVAHR